MELRQLIKVGKAAARFWWRGRSVWLDTGEAWKFFAASHGWRYGNWTADFRLGPVFLTVRPEDWYAFEEIVLDKEYDVVGTLLEGIPRPVVLDLGANIGLFSAVVFTAQPLAFIVAVEASKTTFAWLRRNQERNPELLWEVHHCAVVGRIGDVGFTQGALSTGGRVSDEGEERVQGTTLEWVVARAGGNVDLVKMDIEGSEEDVLTANPQVLKKIRYLLVEIHPTLCNEDRVVQCLRAEFSHLYEILGRKSSKPLILASRKRHNLPEFGSVE